MTTLETVLQEAKKEGRICPQPIKWNEFTKILNEASGSRPPPPLILAAWFEPHLSKILRFDEQIRWAEESGCQEEAAKII